MKHFTELFLSIMIPLILFLGILLLVLTFAYVFYLAYQSYQLNKQLKSNIELTQMEREIIVDNYYNNLNKISYYSTGIILTCILLYVIPNVKELLLAQ